MLQVVIFCKCKSCNEINDDGEWHHMNQIDEGGGLYTIKTEFFCPNCKNTEYDEIEYKDLPKEFLYKYNKNNIKNTLEHLKNSCESKEEFLEIMDSLGYLPSEMKV